MNLDEVLRDADDAAESLWGFTPLSTRIGVYGADAWRELSSRLGLGDARGAYLPLERISIIDGSRPSAPQTLLHEHHGHARLSEQSILGSERRLDPEFYDRKRDPTREYGLFRTHRASFEAFALWTERELARELDIRYEPNTSYVAGALLEGMEEAVNTLTPLGVFGQLALPMRYTRDDLSRTVRTIRARSDEMIIERDRRTIYDPLDVLVIGSGSGIELPWITIEVRPPEPAPSKELRRDSVHAYEDC